MREQTRRAYVTICPKSPGWKGQSHDGAQPVPSRLAPAPLPVMSPGARTAEIKLITKEMIVKNKHKQLVLYVNVGGSRSCHTDEPAFTKPSAAHVLSTSCMWGEGVEGAFCSPVR